MTSHFLVALGLIQVIEYLNKYVLKHLTMSLEQSLHCISVNCAL